MSITISNCSEICHSPTNTSKSKMLFSFPKATRFSSHQKSQCDKFYDMPMTSSLRGTTFGYGQKYDFTSEAPVSPPPNTYELASDFKKNIKKGFGFGQGRAEMEITGPLVETIKNKNPGPGQYSANSSLEKKAYSIRKKIVKDDTWKKSIPGPGAYCHPNALSSTGTYFLAKYKNSCASTFSALSRKQAKTAHSVGPGAYEARDGITADGRYVNSKAQNCAARHFPKQKRDAFKDGLKTPGPGYYRLPSEFGYYLSAKIAKQNKENKENVQ